MTQKQTKDPRNKMMHGALTCTYIGYRVATILLSIAPLIVMMRIVLETDTRELSKDE